MNAFSNSRCWQDFISAVQASVPACAVSYPKVIEALRKSREWFNEAAQDVRTHYSALPAETRSA